MTTEERFERIESTLVRITDRLDRISESHVELETAQANLQRAQTRIAEESHEWRTDFEQKLNALVEHEQVLDRTMLALTGKVDALSDAQKATNEKLDVLVEHEQVLDRTMLALTGKVDALTDAQKTTDEKLKALIVTVDRYIQRRNGNE